MKTALYLGEMKLPVNPAGIRYRLPALSSRYELVGAGEVEVLAGAKLAEVKIEGFLPAEARHYAQDASPPGDYIESLREIVEAGEAIRMIYIGEGWDLNMLMSVQDPVFQERGGSMDVDYQITLRKWAPIEIGLYVGKKGRSTRQSAAAAAQNSQGGGSYTVKSGDTLSHIAKHTLGDSSRWKEIYALNKGTVKNPNLIYPGQELLLPEGAAGTVPTRSHSSRRSSGSSKGSSSSASSANSGGASSGSSKNDKIIDRIKSGSEFIVGANIAPSFNSAGELIDRYRYP